MKCFHYGESVVTILNNRSKNKLAMHMFWVCVLTLLETVQICLHCHTTPSRSSHHSLGIFISWDKLFYCLLIEVRVLCYQLPRHNCFHLAMFFKYVTTKILLHALNTDDNRWGTNSPDIGTISVCSLLKKVHAMWTYFLTHPRRCSSMLALRFPHLWRFQVCREKFNLMTYVTLLMYYQ
jgi:hypothetical protein